MAGIDPAGYPADLASAPAPKRRKCSKGRHRKHGRCVHKHEHKRKRK